MNWNSIDGRKAIEFKTPNEVSSKQHALIVGTILGDGFLQATNISARLRTSHSIKVKGYVDYKYDVLKHLCDTTKAPYTPLTEKEKGLYMFYTAYKRCLLPYHSLFYGKEQASVLRGEVTSCDTDVTDTRSSLSRSATFRKRLPSNLGSVFTDVLSLAIWYLDDGHRRSDCHAYRIATQCFSFEEHIILQTCLQDNFNISVKIERWGKLKNGNLSFGLSIPSKGGHSKAFFNLIHPIVSAEIPSMLYKLGKPRND